MTRSLNLIDTTQATDLVSFVDNFVGVKEEALKDFTRKTKKGRIGNNFVGLKEEAWTDFTHKT